MTDEHATARVNPESDNHAVWLLAPVLYGLVAIGITLTGAPFWIAFVMAALGCFLFVIAPVVK